MYQEYSPIVRRLFIVTCTSIIPQRGIGNHLGVYIYTYTYITQELHVSRNSDDSPSGLALRLSSLIPSSGSPAPPNKTGANASRRARMVPVTTAGSQEKAPERTLPCLCSRRHMASGKPRSSLLLPLRRQVLLLARARRAFAKWGCLGCRWLPGVGYYTSLATSVSWAVWCARRRNTVPHTLFACPGEGLSDIPMPLLPGYTVDDMKTLFEFADQDGDGCLNLLEFFELLNQLLDLETPSSGLSYSLQMYSHEASNAS